MIFNFIFLKLLCESFQSIREIVDIIFNKGIVLSIIISIVLKPLFFQFSGKTNYLESGYSKISLGPRF